MKERLKAAGRYLLARAQEASSWRGLVYIGTALFGWNVPENKVAAVILIGLCIAGLISAAFPDKPK